ncbi:hypothetical protein [Kallipyga massiliensis]|uniref:hypothetical protein n=1 Tax=Kallipyga massiliensis TaxID=1472764 RepID=UPI0026F1031E|nr:hypothetical protein [Kallipyga massiliensis]
MTRYYDHAGQRIHLTDRALGSGGEAKVFEIIGYPQKLVKVYHREADADKRREKILEMVKIGANPAFKRSGLESDLAWPLSPIYNQSHHFIGFGMNKIRSTKELDDLYVYPAKDNLHVTIKDRIDCLISLADLVDRIHRVGLVFGDGNPDNLKIRDDYTVCFLDVDSFHFTSGGKTFPCEVCAPGYVAPELIKKCKGRTYAECPGETFTEETDNFSLAVHCFRMLMNGCHPFSSQLESKGKRSDPPRKTLDQRIEAGESPFFQKIPHFTTPGYAPDIVSLPPYLRDLFKGAFIEGIDRPKSRPRPEEWKEALTRFRKEVTPCRKNASHYYWEKNRVCPYCEADHRHRSAMEESIQTSAEKLPSKKRTPRPPVVTVRVTPSPAPATATAGPAAPVRPSVAGSPRSSIFSRLSLFWPITLLVSLTILYYLGHYTLPGLIYLVAENETVTKIGTVGSCIAGFIGTIHYNRKWAPGRHTHSHRWFEYLLSPLCCLLFAFAFILAMALAYIAVGIILRLLGVLLVILVLIALITGD